MSFAEDLTEAVSRAADRTGVCNVGRWLSTLDEDSRLAFNTYILEGVGPASTLFTVATRHGFTGSATMFRAHCRGGCTCVEGNS